MASKDKPVAAEAVKHLYKDVRSLSSALGEYVNRTGYTVQHGYRYANINGTAGLIEGSDYAAVEMSVSPGDKYIIEHSLFGYNGTYRLLLCYGDTVVSTIMDGNTAQSVRHLTIPDGVNNIKSTTNETIIDILEIKCLTYTTIARKNYVDEKTDTLFYFEGVEIAWQANKRYIEDGTTVDSDGHYAGKILIAKPYTKLKLCKGLLGYSGTYAVRLYSADSNVPLATYNNTGIAGATGELIVDLPENIHHVTFTSNAGNYKRATVYAGKYTASPDTSIPEYYKNQYAAKLAEIKTALFGCDTSFVFFTDTHVAENVNHMSCAKLIPGILQETGIDTVLFGGDAVWAYCSDKSVMLHQVYRMMGCLNACKPYARNVCWVRGNHDFTYKVSADTADGYTATAAEERSLLRKYLPGDNLYYALEEPVSQVKLICLDTSDNRLPDNPTRYNALRKGMTQAQYNWLIGQLSDGGKYIVVIGHIPLSTALDPNGGDSLAPLRGIMEAFAAKSTYSYSGTILDESLSINCNFTGNTSTLVCYLSGHMHKDANALENGILSITTTADYTTNDDPNVVRTMETQLEGAFDVIGIDTANRKIKMIRVGGGENREFSF